MFRTSKSYNFAYVTPIALVALSACKKGEGLTNAVNGAVVKGPLSNALVFLDLNDNNTLDPGEQSIRTEADGSFSITTTANNYKIVAITDASTVDTSSGAVLAGVTLSAPEGAGVVTPTTTLMEEGGLSADQVADVLGLPEGVDPLTFNPYAAGVDAADALAVEKIGQQIITAVTSFASAAEGAGASEAGAFEAAMQSVVDVVADKADGAGTLDFTATDDLDLIKTKVAAEAANLAGIDVTTMNAMIDDTATSIENVNSQIETATDLTSDASKGIFSSLTVLKDQVKAAAEAELATPGSGAATMTFTDPDAVAASAANAQPSAIELSNLSVNEAADSLVVGSATTDDPDQDTGHVYELLEIDGQDHASFAINASTGELSLLAQPDTEAKSSYVVSVQSTDDGGKYTAGTFDIKIKEDPQEALVTLTVTYDTPSMGAGEEYLNALTSLETDFLAFSNAIDTIIQGVDAAMMSSQFAAPVSVTGGYTMTFGSYMFEIVGGTIPTDTITETIEPTPEPAIIATGENGEPIYGYDENTGEPILDPMLLYDPLDPIFSIEPISESSPSSSEHDHAYEDSWSFDQGVTGLIVYENDVEKFRVEVVGNDGSGLDLTLGSAASGAVEKVSFSGDFSTFSFDDFDLLFEGLSTPDDFDDYDAGDFVSNDDIPTDSDTTHDYDDMADFLVDGVEIYREGITSAVADIAVSSSGNNSSYLDTLSITVGEFNLEIVETVDEDLEIMSAGEIFEIANIDLLDVDEILMDEIAATATFGHSTYGPLIVLDSSALESASSIPQMAEAFEIGTVENLTGADASTLDGAKYATDTNDAATIYFDFGSRNSLITDEEFAIYWDGAEDLAGIFTDISDIA